jgi:hypothetical protein
MASGEVRAGIEYAVSGSRCADNPPRERARHAIGVESRLRPQSFTRMWPAIYKKFSTLWADIQQTRVSDDEVARDIQKKFSTLQADIPQIKIAEPGNLMTMSGFKLRITAAV